MHRNGTITPAYRRVIDTLMARADRYYEEAWEVIPKLPDRFGNVVAVAADVYRGIQPQIVRNGYDNLTQRAYTSSWQKAVLFLRARWNMMHLRRAGREAASKAVRRAPVKPSVKPGVGVLARFSALLHIFWSSLLLVPMVIAQPGPTADPSVVLQVRQYYLDSAEEEALIDTAMAFIEAHPSAQADPLVRGYEGALTVMRAKHALWPLRKMAHLRRGLPMLDELIDEHPDHAELRYLRLLSCYYLPGFLGRGWSVQEDAQALAELLPAVRRHYPPDLYQLMVRFVLETDELSHEQRLALREALPSRPSPERTVGRVR